MRISSMLLCLISVCAGAGALADSPFDGTWNLNTAKSQLAGDTMTFEDAGSGTLKYADSSQTYTFKTDGSSFTTPLGTERTFKKSADGSYTTTNKRNGTLLSTSTWKISADGNTLKIESKGTKPNGDTFENSTSYARSSPGSGLLGEWKSTKVKLSSPNSLTIQTDSANGVTLTISAIKATCQAKWDGKDYPPIGPTVADGLVLALTKTGPQSFKLEQKMKTKVLFIFHYHVAADGKTMTAKGTNGQGKEPFTEVYEKQT